MVNESYMSGTGNDFICIEYERDISDIEIISIVSDSLFPIDGVILVEGLDRSSAALIIAGIIAKGSSKIYGLEHLDRGYENFELKLKKLGIKITREFNENNFTENGYKIKSKPEDISQLRAA